MGSQLPPPPAASTATTHAAAADGMTTTISSLGQDPAPRDLPPLAQPAGARPRGAHLPLLARGRPLLPALPPPLPRPPPGATPRAVPRSRRRCRPLLRPPAPHRSRRRRRPPDGAYTGWGIVDCRDGYILLRNMFSLAAVNPMTWAVDIIPMPDDVRAGSGLSFGFLGFHLLSSEENPWSLRVVCVCADVSRVRAAVFSSETWDWAIHPWVEIGGDNSLKYNAGMLVDGSVYWPFHGEHRMIRINTATMEVINVDLPLQVDVESCNYNAGETRDGQLCIVYAADDFHLHVWIRGVDGDGIGIWVPQNILSLSAEIGRVTRGWLGHLRVVQVRSGYVYLSMKCITPVGILRCWFLSLSLETMKIESLIHGTFGDSAYPYIMAWPPCLICHDGSSTGHEVEASH
uniref:F-box protein AT5G49610-like beta-propeller domain-containing protein n=1 Tax=Aegilops tauschii TaxID=37682 RepID=M8BEX6_AEGTA